MGSPTPQKPAEATPAEERVFAYNPDGELESLPLSSARDALANGYRLETPKETSERVTQSTYGGTVGGLKAAGYGALRGATLGLSDVALTKAGVTKPEELKGLKEANPTTSIASEIGGAVLPTLLSGGGTAAGTAAGAAKATAKPGLLGQAIRTVGAPARAVAATGRAAEQGVARLIGDQAGKGVLRELGASALSKGVGSAVEGAFMATGQLVSEDALGSTDLTAEKVMTHVGLGALLGGAIGGGLGGAGLLGKKAVASSLEKVGGSLGVKQLIQDFAQVRAVSALGATGGRVAKVAKKGRLEQLGDDLLNPSPWFKGKPILEAGGNLKRVAANIDDARSAAGAVKGDLIKQFDELAVGLAKSTSGKVGQAAGTVAARPGKIRNLADEWLIDANKVADRIQRELLDDIAKTPGLEAEVSALSGLVKRWRELGKGGKLSFAQADKFKRQIQGKIKWDKMQPNYADALKWRAEGVLNGEIRDAAQRVSEAAGRPELFAKFTEANRFFGSMSEAAKLIENGIDRQQGNRWFSLSDYLSSGALGVGGAVMGGPLGAAGGMALGMAHKFVRERGSAWAAHAAKHVQKLAAVERAGQATTKSINKAIDGYLTGKGKRVALPAAIESLEGIKLDKDASLPAVVNKGPRGVRHMQQISYLATDPGALNDRVSRSLESINEVAPKVAAQVGVTAANAVQFLASKAPTPPAGLSASLQPQLSKWRPTAGDMAKWTRYLRAANDPRTVLADMQAGRLTPEAVETMKELYPQMYAEISKEIAMKATELREKLPYRKRVQLSMWFNVPVDPTATPDFVALSQQWHAVTRKQREKASKPRPDSGPSEMAEGLKTDYEKLRS